MLRKLLRRILETLVDIVAYSTILIAIVAVFPFMVIGMFAYKLFSWLYNVTDRLLQQGIAVKAEDFAIDVPDVRDLDDFEGYSKAEDW